MNHCQKLHRHKHTDSQMTTKEIGHVYMYQHRTHPAPFVEKGNDVITKEILMTMDDSHWYKFMENDFPLLKIVSLLVIPNFLVCMFQLQCLCVKLRQRGSRDLLLQRSGWS